MSDIENKKRERSTTSSLSFLVGEKTSNKKGNFSPSTTSESFYELNKISERTIDYDFDNENDDAFATEKDEELIEVPVKSRLRNRNQLRSVERYDEKRHPSTNSSVSTKTSNPTTLQKTSSLNITKKNGKANITKPNSLLYQIKNKKNKLIKKKLTKLGNHFARGRGGQNSKTQEMISAQHEEKEDDILIGSDYENWDTADGPAESTGKRNKTKKENKAGSIKTKTSQCWKYFKQIQGSHPKSGEKCVLNVCTFIKGWEFIDFVLGFQLPENPAVCTRS